MALIGSYADGLTDDEAFEAAIGMDVAAFDDAWLADLGAVVPDQPRSAAGARRPATGGLGPGRRPAATSAPGEPAPVATPAPGDRRRRGSAARWQLGC